MDESLLVELIKGSPDERRKALGFLYDSDEYKNPVISFLRKKNLPKEDQLTLWTDVVLKFSTLVLNGKYQHQGKLLSFLLNLANFLCLNHFRDQKKHSKVDTMDETHDEIATNQAYIYPHDLNNAINLVLNKLNDTCKKIITHWAEGYSMREIMVKIKLPSESATRKRKHICMKKLLSFVESKKDIYNQLLEHYNNRS